MSLIDREQKTSVVLLLLISVLGLTAVFEAEYSHEMVYYSYFVLVPLLMYYLLKGIPGNHFSLAVHLPLIFFLFFNALSLIWTININETLGELYKLVFYLIIYYLAGAYLEERNVEKLITVVLIIGTFIALLGILLYLFESSRRIISVFNNPNPFGMYLAMLSLAGMGIYLNSSRNRLLVLSLVIITSALVLTGSRGSLLSYAFVLPFFFFFIPKENIFKQLRKALLLFFTVAASVFFITYSAPLIQSYNFSMEGLNLGSINTDAINKLVVRDISPGASSVIGRLSFWQVAWNMGVAHPFTGIGLGTYHIAYNSFRLDDKWWSMFAHNHYLQIWAETGLFALLSFLAFFFIFYIFAFGNIKAVGNKGLYLGLIAACAAFLLHIFVDFTWNMPTVTILFWTFLGCITALQSNERPYYFKRRINLFHYGAAGLILIFLLGSGQQFLAYRSAVSGEYAQDGGSYQEALDKYQLACRIFPYRAEYFGALSENYYNLYLESKNQTYLEQAIDARQKAIDLSPYDYKNYVTLGRILWQENRNGAEENLIQAVKLGGFTPGTFHYLGYFYLAKERFAEGEEVLKNGLEQSVFAYKNAPGKGEKAQIIEEQVHMHLGLAMIYNSYELHNKEKEQLEEALKLDPQNAVALRQLEKF